MCKTKKNLGVMQPMVDLPPSEPRPKTQPSPTRGIFQKVPGGAWWIRYTDGDKRYRRERVGSYNAARQLLEKRHTEATQRVKLPENFRTWITFAEIAQDAIAYITKHYSRPADDLCRLRLLMDHITGRADAIPRGKFLSVINTLATEKKWSQATKNHYLNLLSLTFRLAVENEKLKDNPLRGLRRKKGNEIVRFLTLEEETKLRAVIRSKPEWAEHEPELDLAIHTGLRRGSMYLDLVWENVDLVGCTLTIPRTKNGDPITLPLNQDAMRAMKVFRARGDGTGRVVRNAAGETLNVNAHWFVPAVRAAKIKPFRWHDCRHTFASRLRQAGVPLGNIAELLGHKGLAMTLRYSHLAISNLHEAVSRIAISTTVAPEPKMETREVAYLQ